MNFNFKNISKFSILIIFILSLMIIINTNKFGLVVGAIIFLLLIINWYVLNNYIVKQEDINKLLKEKTDDLSKFKLAVDHASDHIAITDPNGIIIYANSAAEKITGYSNKEIIGKKAGSKELWGGHMSKEFYQNMWNTIKEGKHTFKGQIKNQRKNGEFYFAEVSISPILNDKKELIFFVAVERDITNEKEKEDYAIKNKALIESVGEIVYDHKVPDKKIYWEGVEKTLGFTKEEFGESENSWFDHCHPDDKDRVFKELEKAISEKRSYELEYRFVTKDGGYKWFKDIGATFFGEEGELVRVIGILKNITESVEQMKSIRDLSDRLKLATDSSGIGIWELDLKTQKLNWNENMYKIYGKNKSFNLNYGSWVESLSSEDKNESEKVFQEAVKTGKDFNYLFKIIRENDKMIRYIKAHAVILKDDVGYPYKAIGVNLDVTHEKEIDKAKSEFVSLASHQLRTPLSAIRWYSEILADQKVGKLNKKQKEYLKEIDEGNKRMISLVNSLLNVSRIELGTFVIDPVELDFVEKAMGLISEFKVLAKNNKVKLKTNFEKDLPKIKADDDLLGIIYQNLLSNAIKYTPEKGNVEFSIFKKDKNVIIEVSDNGFGIPKKQQDKIFTKLFRADNIQHKDVSGTGLGLYIIKNVLDQVGGKIYFESEEGIGTKFTVELPFSGMKNKQGTRKLT